MSRFDHVMPTSLEAALELNAEAGSRILAGGTDLLRELHAGSVQATRLVSLRGLPGLDRIETTPKGGLMIGARVTLAELCAHRDIRKHWTALADAALGAASPALRNVATIAGNLLQRPACEYYRTDFQCTLKGGTDCPARAGDNTHHAIFGGSACISAHPSDTAAAFLSLDARIHSDGPKGLHTRPVTDIYKKPTAARPSELALPPGEIITAIELPPAIGRSLYLQARERQTWAFALVGVAARLDLNAAGRIRSARVALCGVAPIPWALPTVDAWLRGRAITKEGWAEEAGRRAALGARPLEHNRYKVELVKGLVARAMTRLAGRG